jgi:adhesin transport system membrane fusion protein
VKKGDILIRLDSTPTRTSLGEVEARVRALRAQIARLRIEHEGDPSQGFTCPLDLSETAPEVCANEAKLMELRNQNFRKTVEVLKQRVEQRQRELNERRANMERITNNLELARQELKLLEPLAKRNLVSQTDYLRAQRETSDLEGQSNSVREEIGRIEASLREATLQVEEANLRYRQEASAELTKVLAELSIYRETARGAEDRVARTDIRSPVDGIVNSLNVTTIGAFVNAGTHVADVVPIDDQLLIEGRVLPSDIAFIRPGQEAIVKITSYDFSIYGGLAGMVEHVSADTIYDDVAKETFYTVVIRTDQASLSRNGREYPIIPGMVTQVDILTGKKTILQYLLKPINKARQEALRER